MFVFIFILIIILIFGALHNKLEVAFFAAIFWMLLVLGNIFPGP